MAGSAAARQRAFTRRWRWRAAARVVIERFLGRVGLRTTNPNRRDPDDRQMMDLKALLEKAPDADFLRETIGFAAKR